ncbi:hypothetical protein LCGC14_1027150 [marine sediment metagenome]|uniref:Uncharacterized protein n=1 Tax=marine sediment metagenome TaxID=412755 RepID=A0A0F9MVR1_9ZZZZ
MIKYETRNLKERRKFHYLEIHKWIFRLVIYKMRHKYYFCTEISIGWQKKSKRKTFNISSLIKTVKEYLEWKYNLLKTGCCS